MSKVVAVVGGGLAGLAAAIRLVDAGYRPVVIESRRMLGGRATSFVDPRNDALIDNCQHVLMGCCTNLIDLYDRFGVLDEIEWHRTLYWSDGGHVDRVTASWLPAPFHLAPSFSRMRVFDRAQRRQIRQGMWRIIRLGARGSLHWADHTFAEFLRDCGQDNTVIRRFWDVIITSACNMTVEQVGAGYALQVFQQGFLNNRWSYTMGLATVPLVALYDAARDVLELNGGEVRMGTSARAIAFDGNRVQGVVTTDGLVEATDVISAVPFDRLDRLLSKTMRRADKRLGSLMAFKVSPILGAHLWFDQTVMDLPHLVLVDHDVQWLFNKGIDLNGRQHLHAVISAADEWMTQPEDRIVERVLSDLHEALPAAVGLDPVQVRCIKEKRATFAALPGAEALRPSVEPQPARGAAIENLFLAGDWCDTGWPATMEGAVRSGYAAADGVLRRDGQVVKGLVEDVPPGRIAKWLMKR